MKQTLVAAFYMALASLLISCNKTAPHSIAVAMAAETAPLGAGPEDLYPAAFDEALPLELYMCVEELVEGLGAEGGLTDDEMRLASEILAEYRPTTGTEHRETWTFFRALRERAVLFAAPMLVSEDVSQRLAGLNVLGFTRPPLSPRVEEDDYLEEDVLLPIILRSSYDVDASVRGRAISGLTGTVRACLRTRRPKPESAMSRIRQLVTDPDPDIAHSTLWFLWQMGEYDLLTPEQIEEFEKGPRE